MPARRTAPGKVARRRAPGPVRLGSQLTIAEVTRVRAALHARLEAAVARADATALQSIDTAGLQLLLMVARHAQERGLKLELRGGERVLKGAAEALGLTAQLSAAVELTT